jgi:hypothetical protein
MNADRVVCWAGGHVHCTARCAGMFTHRADREGTCPVFAARSGQIGCMSAGCPPGGICPFFGTSLAQMRGTGPFLEWRPWAAGGHGRWLSIEADMPVFGAGCGHMSFPQGRSWGRAGHVQWWGGLLDMSAGWKAPRETCPVVLQCEGNVHSSGAISRDMSSGCLEEWADWVHVRWLSVEWDMPILWHGLRGTCPFFRWDLGMEGTCPAVRRCARDMALVGADPGGMSSFPGRRRSRFKVRPGYRVVGFRAA